MKRKMTSALSLFLTAAMLGTSVPSVVLAEDFSQQPDVQWDSEAVDETADPEGQDQTEEVTGGISVSDNNSENSSEDMGTGAGDDFTSDVTEEPEDKTEESGNHQKNRIRIRMVRQMGPKRFLRKRKNLRHRRLRSQISWKRRNYPMISWTERRNWFQQEKAVRRGSLLRETVDRHMI